MMGRSRESPERYRRTFVCLWSSSKSVTRLRAATHLALETLTRHPLRTALSTLGIIMGSASLTAVLAIGDGAEAFARQAIEREGWNDVSLSPVMATVIDGVSVPVDGYPLFDVDIVDQLVSTTTGRASVHLAVEGPGRLEVPVGPARVLLVVGRLDAPAPPARGLTLAEGRWFTEREARTGEAVAVVGHRLAQWLRETGRPGGIVGEVFEVAGRRYQVVGILQPVPGERALLLQVPFAGAETLMMPATSPRPRRIALHVPNVEDVPAIREAVEALARGRSDWTDKYAISALGPERLDQLSRGILTFKLLMGAFTAISLLVGGVGIMNVLLASILERTREIGVRKAVGARRRDVLWQFLIESMTVAIAGASAGVALGMAGAFAVTAVIRAQSEAQLYAAWTWPTAVIAGASAVAIGLAAGLYPALRAARLSPLEAITRE